MLTIKNLQHLIKNFAAIGDNLLHIGTFPSIYPDTDLYVFNTDMGKFVLISSDYIGESDRDFLFGLTRKIDLKPIREVSLNEGDKWIYRSNAYSTIPNYFVIIKVEESLDPTEDSTSILIYAFTHEKKLNISSEVIMPLPGEKFLINYSTNKQGLQDLEELLTKIKQSQFRYIIGVGIYTTPKEVIKIETLAKSKFRNDLIYPDGKDYFPISQFVSVPDSPHYKVSTKMGNSWCNLSSYKIAQFLHTKKLNAQNAFFHIPASANVSETTTKLKTLFKELI